MAKIPQTQLNDQYRRLGIEPSPTPRVSLAPLMDAAEVITQKMSQRAGEKAATQAAKDQMEAGAATLLQPGADQFRWDAAEEAYRKQARAVHSQQVSAEAAREVGRITDENRGRPDAFAEAWQKYQESVVDRLADADPEYALQMRQSLTDVGNRALLRVDAETRAFDRASKETDFETGIAAQVDTVQRQMLNEPDEELMLSTIASISQSYEDAKTADGGFLVSPDNAVRRTKAHRDALVSTYVDSVATRAMESGDVGALRALQAKLQNDAWYSDVEDARKAAAGIGRRVDAMLSSSREGADFRAKIAAEALDTQFALATNGLPVDPEHVRRQLDIVEASGTPTQRLNAWQKGAAAISLSKLDSEKQSMTLADYDAQILSIAEQRGEVNGTPLGATEVNALVSSLKKERSALLEAAAGDAWKAAPPLRIGEAPPEQFAQARETLARKLGKPADLIPVYGDDAMAAFSSSVTTALDNRNPEEAVRLLTAFQQGAGAPRAVMGALGKKEAVGAQVYLPMLLSVSSPDMSPVHQLLTFAAAGGPDALKAAGESAPVDVNDVIGTQNFRKLTKMVGGGPQTAGDMAAFLSRAYAGAATTNDSPKKALQQLLAPLLDSGIELPNGGLVPAAMAGVTTKRGDILHDVVLEQLADPENTFDLPQGSEQLEYFRPVAIGSGVLAWEDIRTGDLVKKNDQPVFIDAPSEVAVELHARQIPKLLDSMAEGIVDNLLQNESMAASSLAKKAAAKKNVPAPLLDAMFFATKATPMKERNGAGVYNLNTYAAMPNQNAVGRNRTPSRAGPDQAATELRRVLDKYPDDMEAALIEFTLGEAEVSALRAAAGENWKRSIPMAELSWVHRAMEAYER